MSQFTRPDGFDPGGLFVFNPPEPRAHFTNLSGVWTAVRPPGNSRSIPGGYKIDLGPGTDPNPNIAALYGEHVLQLRHGSVSSDTLADYHPLGLWSSANADDAYPFAAWTLYYGRLKTVSGDYADQGLWPGGEQWWLIALWQPSDGVSADVYQFLRPQSDEGVLPLDRFDGSTSRFVFDALRPNVFQYAVPSLGGAPSTGEANETIVVAPYYP